MAADLELLMNNAMEGWSGVIKPQRYACPVHGLHPDWVQFNWSQRAGMSDLLCLRCIETYLEARIPGVVVSGTGPGGGGGGGTVTSPPKLLLSASPTAVVSGGTAQLAWSSVNATSVVASGGWSGNQALNGAAVTPVLLTPTAFTLTATGPGGTVSRTVTVAITPVTPPVPVITLNASSSSVTSGNAVTLTWSVTNSNTITASGGWSGNRAATGSQSTGPLSATTTFTLSATGAGGTVTQSVTVAVGSIVQVLQVNAVNSSGTYGHAVGFDVNPGGTPFGSITPANMPSGGTALGLPIQALVTWFEIPMYYDLILALPHNANTTQTNQFDSIQVVDDTGTLRTFLASGVMNFTYDTSLGLDEWRWGNGSNPVMQTNGKAYTFTVTKA